MPRHTQDLVYPSSSEVSWVYCRLQTKILCLVPVPAHMGGQGQAGPQGQHPGSCPWSWGMHGVLECLLGHSWGVCPCWGGGRCFPASSPGRACQVSTASCLAAFADTAVSQVPPHAPSQQVLVLKGQCRGFFQMLKLVYCCLPRV